MMPERWRRIAELFLSGAAKYRPDHIDLFDGILLGLVPHTEMAARAGNADGVTPTESEVPTGMPAGAFGDNMGGITIAGAVAAALYGRQTTGQTSVMGPPGPAGGRQSEGVLP